jgi:hypothetical protein
MKIELSLSPEYVIHWSLKEALRELFQNAVDNGIDRMSWNYDKDRQELEIISIDTQIEKNTLLLGKSDKTGSAIGKFGEGYKLALLVLTRLQRPVSIYTGGERWFPRFVMNTVLQSKTLNVYIEPAEYSPDTVIRISGISKQEFEDYKKNNLHLQEYPEHTEGMNGKLLTGAGQRGNVYVNGLYITRLAGFEYGYDFNPNAIDLGRDRNIVSEFELKWSGKSIIDQYAKENPEDIIRAAKKKIKDFEYLSDISDDAKSKITDVLLERYGENAVFYHNVKPENLIGEYHSLPYKLYSAVTSSSRYKKHLQKIEVIPKETTEEFLLSWLEYWSEKIPEEVQESFKEQLIPRIVEG